MADTSVAIAIATVVSTAISGGVGYLTHRSSARSAAEVAEVETRGDIEKNAFDKAYNFLSTTIDRQDAEIEQLAAEAATANATARACQLQVQELQAQVSHYRRIGRRLAGAVYDLRRELNAKGVQTAADRTLDDAVLEFLGGDTNPPPRSEP